MQYVGVRVLKARMLMNADEGKTKEIAILWAKREQLGYSTRQVDGEREDRNGPGVTHEARLGSRCHRCPLLQAVLRLRLTLTLQQKL